MTVLGKTQRWSSTTSDVWLQKLLRDKVDRALTGTGVCLASCPTCNGGNVKLGGGLILEVSGPGPF